MLPLLYGRRLLTSNSTIGAEMCRPSKRAPTYAYQEHKPNLKGVTVLFPIAHAQAVPAARKGALHLCISSAYRGLRLPSALHFVVIA